MLIYLIFAVVFAVAQSALTKCYNLHNNDSIGFNIVRSVCALVCMLLIGLKGFEMHLPTLVYGGLFGVFLAASMYTGFKALLTGPMSLTSLICSCSVIIPVTYGIAFCKENVTAYKVLGFIFLGLTIAVANVGKKNKSNEYNYGKWFLYTFITFAANGLCSVIQKAHQSKYPQMYMSEFMTFAMAVCTLFFLLVGVFGNHGKRNNKNKLYAVFTGIACALANFLTVKLAGLENASVLYPVISAGTIMGALAFGAVFLRERLKVNQIAALVCGMASVVFLKL